MKMSAVTKNVANELLSVTQLWTLDDWGQPQRLRGLRLLHNKIQTFWTTTDHFLRFWIIFMWFKPIVKKIQKLPPNGICIFQENLCWKITKSKACYVEILTNCTFFVYMTYPNSKFSFKNSADFSCLFTFFQKNCKSIIFFTALWELHNWQLELVICLHFWITT